MSNFCTIWRRELASCFLSPVAYVLMVVFLSVASGTFVLSMVRGEDLVEPIPVVFYNAVLVWLTILATVICMRLFAEEKRTGSLELLMTVPVTETEVVLGKFAGALSFLLLVIAPVFLTPFLLVGLSPGLVLSDIDPGGMASGAVALVLIAGLCTAVGLVVSLLTRNQIVAGIGCFCGVWLVLLLGWVLSMAPGAVNGLAEYLGVPDHLTAFAQGVVDTRPIVLYVSSTVWLLFVGVRVLESSRWR
jgi:ABC-2 type transport system permease protein